jgi:hypothetical protein
MENDSIFHNIDKFGIYVWNNFMTNGGGGGDTKIILSIETKKI